MEHNFRPTYAREDSQMFMTRKPGDYWWCRSCATKFRVCYSANHEGLHGEGREMLTVEVWHNFGSYSAKAMDSFGYLIKGSKNDEMKSLSRTFLDFKTEEVEMIGKREDVVGSHLMLHDSHPAYLLHQAPI